MLSRKVSLGFASNDQFAPRVGIAENIAQAFVDAFLINQDYESVLAYIGEYPASSSRGESELPELEVV